MMEDWTDIIGEELENIEEPLPADDWSVLQQKYAAAQKRKKAAAFAWAGGITSVAAAVALMLLLVRPDVTSVIPEQTASVIPDPIGDLTESVAETLPSTEEIVPIDSNVVEHTIDTVLRVAPSAQKKVSVPVYVVKKSVDDVLIAENNTEEITAENTEEVFDVIRDTTSLKDKLLADASITNKKDSSDDAYTEPTGTFGFDDFPEDELRRKRRPMSIGMSGSVSGSPIIKVMDVVIPEAPTDSEMPKDTTDVETPAPAAVMMRNSRKYNESYRHEIPISFGVSVRYNITDKLSVNTGLNYTRYTSTRERYYYTGGADMDKQYAHYLGIPVRLDWLAVNKKHFNFYIGAGVQADKCIYATVGNERLREKEVLFGLNGALGFQVNIVPKVGLYFEPEISYALNEGSIETFRYNEPLMISARAGLRFNF
mgnify:CR=1